MSKPTLGVIGGGFVGGSFADGFKHYTDTKLYDKDPKRCVNTFEEVAKQDVIVVALPTPMQKDGAVSTSIVEGVLDSLEAYYGENGIANDLGFQPVIVKSTIPPAELETLNVKYEHILVMYSPEFLTERTARLDFQQSNRIIVGTVDPPDDLDDLTVEEQLVHDLFALRFPMVPIYWTSLVGASLIKYFTNVFFCTKVSILNEFYQVCEMLGEDYEDIIGLVMMDQRIGRSHYQVPGHDGKLGFGGHCFPKDLNGYMHIAKSVDVKPTVSRAAWEKNLEVRPERDWEEDKGRAVVEDE